MQQATKEVSNSQYVEGWLMCGLHFRTWLRLSDFVLQVANATQKHLTVLDEESSSSESQEASSSESGAGHCLSANCISFDGHS